MLQGKKVIPILHWTMNLQSPMLRGKKTYNPFYHNQHQKKEYKVITDDLSTLLTRDNIPWTLGYHSPMNQISGTRYQILNMKYPILDIRSQIA